MKVREMEQELNTALDRLRIAVSTSPQLTDDLQMLQTKLVQFESTRDQLRTGYEALMKLARSEALGKGQLEVALREITEVAAQVLRVARTSIWLYNTDQTSIQCIELFLTAERGHEAGVELFAKDFPSYFRALTLERTIAAHDANTDSRTAEFSEVYLKPLGITSMLDAPIRVGGQMIGVTCNEHVGAAREWSADEQQFAGSLADFVALAIEGSRRSEAEEQLRRLVEALEANQSS